MLDIGNNRVYTSHLGQRPLAEAKGRGLIQRVGVEQWAVGSRQNADSWLLTPDS
jgi:hypothetical protein